MNSRQLTYATVAIIPLIYIVGAWHAPFITDPTLIKSAAAEIFASVLLLIWLSTSRYPAVLNIISGVALTAALLFVYVTLSVIWASNKDFFLDAWLKWFTAAVIFYLSVLIGRDQSRTPIVLRVFVISAVLVALIGLAQQYFDWDYLVQSAKPGSTFSNRNMAGHIIVICLPLALFQIFHSQTSAVNKAIYVLAFTLLALYAFHIKAAGTWAAIAVEIVIIGVWFIWHLSRTAQWNRNRFIIAVVSGLSLVAGFGLPFYQSASLWSLISHEVAGNLTEMMNPENGLGSRLDIWRGALAMIGDAPILGVGLGNFYEIWSNGSYIQHSNLLASQRVHNDLLELTVDLGLIGIGLTLFLATIVGLSGFRLLSHEDETTRLSAVVIMTSLMGFLVSGLVSFPLQVIAPLVSIAMLAGLLTGMSEQSFRSFAVPIPRLKPLAIALALTLSVSTVYINRQWLSDMETLSVKYNDGTQVTPWKPESVVTNPNLINTIRMIVIGNLRYGGLHQANSFVVPLLSYWPEEPLNLALATEVSLNLEKLQESEDHANRLRLVQPIDSLAAEHYLLAIYSKRSQGDQLRDLYQEMRKLDPQMLQRELRHFAVLHCLSIMFKDPDMTEKLYRDYRAIYDPDPVIEANMAVHYANAGQIDKAIELGRWVAGHDSGLGNSWQLSRIRNSEEAIVMKPRLRPFHKVTFETLKREPLLHIFGTFM